MSRLGLNTNRFCKYSALHVELMKTSSLHLISTGTSLFPIDKFSKFTAIFKENITFASLTEYITLTFYSAQFCSRVR